MDRHATCSAIQAASTQGEVIAVLRKYLSAIDSRHAALLPATLLSVGVNHAQEIAQAAIELAAREITVEEPAASILRDAATVLSTAAMRLAVLSTA